MGAMMGGSPARSSRSGSSSTARSAAMTQQRLSEDGPDGSRRRDLTRWVVALSLVSYALLTHSHLGSWNDSSRLATAEALVEQGTWAIENTRLGRLTADYILWNGHFYSDKPPVLSFLAAGVYGALNAATGVAFVDEYCQPTLNPHYCFALFDPRAADWAYYLVTLLLVGIPSALMLGLFYRATDFFGLTNPMSLALAAALGVGTMVFPFSLVFSNHVPAAAALMLGLYALLRSKKAGKAKERWLIVAGFGTALAVTFDLLSVPFLPAFNFGHCDLFVICRLSFEIS